MAAFSAVVSLEQLLNQLLNSNQLPKEELVPLHEKICCLKSSLEKIFPAPKKDRDEANKLTVQIRDKIYEAQDTIESFIFSTQNHPPETSKARCLTSFSLQKITADIDPLVEDAKMLGDSIAEGKNHSQPVKESQTIESSSIGLSTKPVGQEEYKALIENKLLATTDSLLVIPICGMPGIGKTTLAKSIYEDVQFMNNFSYKAWVTVSQDANVQDICAKILHSLESRGQRAGDKKYEGDEGMLRIELHKALYKKKYLVVIDDLWDTEIWRRIRTSLPDNKNSSRVLVTTRTLKVADFVKSTDGLVMEPLNYLDSWTLLRNKTFGDDQACPPELENYGRRISSNCNGHPLSLLVIGGLLSQGRKDVEYWRSIEEDTKTNAYDTESYSGILSLSYDLLPCKLKPCFLYMAAFPQDADIPVSKLIRLWVAEGFLTIPSPRQLILQQHQPPPPLIEKVAEQSLLGLIERNLVTIRKNRSNGEIRAVGMHSSLRDLAEKEAGKDMFFHLRKKHPQKAEQGTSTQRRVSVRKNILMCLDDVYNSTKAIEKARSLLYVGSHHQHPMPYNLTFDLLRVLDAFTVFFIEFPNEIIKLIHLRYLSLTYNGKLPSKIAKLHKLQILIVKRQPKFIYVGSPFLPDEIWSMKELRHLIITETDLPLLSPSTETGSILFENLQTLSNVNATSCTQEVLDNMPNLKKLKMWVEAPGKVGLYLHKLHQLEVFKFAVMEPIPGKAIEFKPQLFFPDTVTQLNLSGCGLPWEDMEVIAALPNLQVLKLKELAFHGDEWCPTYDFKKLKFLLIEYLNLKRWEAEAFQFQCLEQLIIRHCYEVEELPLDFADAESLRLIELVDCSPEAVKWAEYIIEVVEDYGYENLKVRIYSSWE